jgi:Tfp pilus assembly protein PilO
MNSTRIWTLISVLVIAGLLLGTWFVGVSPRLAESSAANADRSSVEALNATHRATLVALKEQFEDIDQLRTDLDELRVSVPDAAMLPDLISQLNASAADAGVAITSIKFGDPTPYAPIENVDADPQLASALQSVAPENFLVIPVDLDISGEFGKVTRLISTIQNGERLFLIHDLKLAEGVMEDSATVTVTTSGQVFVLLEGVAAPPATAPEGDVAPAEGAEVPQ